MSPNQLISMKTSSNSFISQLIVALPLAVFIIFFFSYVLNVAWFDDYESLSGFFLEFQNAPTWSEKAYWLFLPNNEHRMVTAKLLVLATYYLTGELQYVWMQALANLTEVFIWVLFLLAFRRMRLSLWYFLPVTLFMFQPQHYLLTFLTNAGLQHEPLLFFAFATLFVLAKGTPASAAGALVLAFITTFTMSNGMFVWIAGGIILVLRKRYSFLLIWGLAMALAIGGYYYHYPSTANGKSFSKFLEAPQLSLLGFFTYLGAAFDFFPNASAPWRYILPTLAGVGLMTIAVLWFRKNIWPVLLGYFRTTGVSSVPDQERFVQDFLLGTALFLLANNTIIAVLRPHFGYHVMLISNYKLYPTLFLCVAYMAWLSMRRDYARTPKWLIPASVLIYLGLYLAYFPIAEERRKNLLTATFNQYHAGIGLGATRGSFLEPYIQRNFMTPLEKGIYNPPIHFFDPVLAQSAESQVLSLQTQETATHYLLTQPDLTVPRGRNSLLLLHVKSTERPDQYLIPFQALPNTGRNPFRPGVGGKAELPKDMLRPGSYELQVLYQDGTTLKRYPTLNKLSI